MTLSVAQRRGGEAVDPTDWHRPVAAEHIRSHGDIGVGVSVGVHANVFIRAGFFVCSYKGGLAKSL